MTPYILAVDDVPDNLFLVKLTLEQEGHRVVTTDNGAEALAIMEKSAPDLILLDVMMPGMDGYEVTRRIRQNPNLPYIPILLITAHEQSSVVIGLDMGADEFIRKPVQLDELQARVRALLRLKNSIDQRENFVSCLTHDLRTPLVAANRMLNLIRGGIFGEMSKEICQAIAQIECSNDNMLQMLDTLLEVHHYEEGQKIISFITFNLPDLIEEIVKEQMPMAQAKQLDLNMQVEEGIGEIRGDRLELRRVFANLISNAIKFSDVGSVEVSLAKASANSSNEVKITVKDTGVGIPPQDLPYVFDRFKQGNNKRSGHGLGLHLCSQIVQAHKGKIEVQSEVDRGSCFTVYLPVST